MPADVLDIFAAAATPAWRTERPAQVRARMAWARQRLAAARAAPLQSVQGVGIGDHVMVDIRPGVTALGKVAAWDRGPTGAVATVALTLPTLYGVGDTVRAPRHRLNPFQEPQA